MLFIPFSIDDGAQLDLLFVANYIVVKLKLVDIVIQPYKITNFLALRVNAHLISKRLMFGVIISHRLLM